jgi:hypothetical protein
MYLWILKPARISPKQKEEQAEDSSPDPSSSACDIRIQKKESAEVLRNPFPRKLFPQNFVRIVSDFLIGIAYLCFSFLYFLGEKRYVA